MLTEQYRELNKENSTNLLDRYFNTSTLQRLKGRGMFYQTKIIIRHFK